MKYRSDDFEGVAALSAAQLEARLTLLTTRLDDVISAPSGSLFYAIAPHQPMRQNSFKSTPASPRSANRKVALAACLLLVASAACGEGAGARQASAAAVLPPAAVIDEVVRWRGGVKLEENRQVINVFPQVSFAPGGAFLVADGREAQIRVYGGAGELRSWFGSRGEGPGEFFRPAAALPHDSGMVLTVDFVGKYAVFDTASRRAIETGRLPVTTVYTAKPLGGGRLLLVGRVPGGGGQYLHLWDLRHKRLLHSFFVPPVRRGYENEAIIAGTMDASVRGDSIAALYALCDSIFLFTDQGVRIGALPLKARGLRPMTHNVRPGGREAIMEWMESFSTPSRIFWLSDGSFLVQYYDLVGNEQRFTLMHLGRNGEPLYEISGTPRLFTASPAGETLVFQDPRFETPNQWLLASLR